MWTEGDRPLAWSQTLHHHVAQNRDKQETAFNCEGNGCARLPEICIHTTRWNLVLHTRLLRLKTESLHYKLECMVVCMESQRMDVLKDATETTSRDICIFCLNFDL